MRGVGGWITDDLDICFADDVATRERLAALLAEWGARYREGGAEAHLTQADLGGSKILNLSAALGDLDLLRRVPGVGSFEACIAAADWLDVDDVRVATLSAQGILEAKRMADRTKDHLHILSIEQRLEGSADPAAREPLYTRLPRAVPALSALDRLTLALGASRWLDGLQARLLRAGAAEREEIEQAVAPLPTREQLAQEVMTLAATPQLPLGSLSGNESKALARARSLAPKPAPFRGGTPSRS